MNYGIVFYENSSPQILALSEKMREFGLCDYVGDKLTAELADAINEYRQANSIDELDYCDPALLRALGIQAEGDEIIILARVAETLTEDEIGCYDLCAKIIKESESCKISLTEAALRYEQVCESMPMPSKNAVTAAILAFINK